MELAQTISSLILSIRKKLNIRVRQPLNRALIPLMSDHLRNQVESVKKLILSEVNVKDLEYISDTAGILVKKVKPDFKKLGPRYGKMMKTLAEMLTTIDQASIAELEREGKITLMVNGQPAEIFTDDVEIQSEDIPGWHVANQGSLTVALDVNITPELWKEGIAREVINRIQNLRKDKGFEVTDKIEVEIESHEEINEALNKNVSYICSEILAEKFNIVPGIETEDKVLVGLTDTIATSISIRKINQE